MTTSSFSPSIITDTSPALPPQKRLIFGLGLAAFGGYVALSGVPGVVVAVQLQEVAPESKEAALAMVASIGAAIGVFVTPMWGAVSDRSRSRFGRRTPIIIAGTIIALLALLLLSVANSVPSIAAGMFVLKIGFSAFQAAVLATLPDRVSDRLRGIAAGVLSFGIMIGGVVGGAIGSALVQIDVPLAYALGAGLFLLLTIGFVIVNREQSARDLPRPVFDLASFIKTFWVNPRRYPDFAWAFWSRAAMYLGFSTVNTFLLYILQDHIGLSQADALGMVPQLAAINAGGVVVSILLSGWLSDRTGRRKVFVFTSSVVSGLAALIPMTTPTVTGMMVFAFVLGLGYGCFLAVDTALITLVLPSRDAAGKDLGVANIASGAALAMGPLIAGLIITTFGVYPPLFIISFALSVAGGFLVLPVKGVR